MGRVRLAPLRKPGFPVGSIYSFSALTWSFTGRQRVGTTIGETGGSRPRRGAYLWCYRTASFSRSRRLIGASSIWTQHARIPYLDVHGRDDSLIKETERFLALERKERVELHTWPERCEPSAALSMLSWSTFSGPTRR